MSFKFILAIIITLFINCNLQQKKYIPNSQFKKQDLNNSKIPKLQKNNKINNFFKYYNQYNKINKGHLKKKHKSITTKKKIKLFIKSNIKNDTYNNDYILYILGKTYIKKIKNNKLKQIFYLNNYHEYNIKNIKKTIKIFEIIINNYPNSKYKNIINKKLTLLKNIIFLHELHIIKFYFTKHAYLTTIKRSKKTLNKFFYNKKYKNIILIYITKCYKKINIF